LGVGVSNVRLTGKGRADFPKNAREYVHVGLGRAIPGAPRFWKVRPALALIILCAGPIVEKQVGRITTSSNPTYECAVSTKQTAVRPTESGAYPFPKMSAAKDGRRQAHMDVLVAFFGKGYAPLAKLQAQDE